MNKQSNKEMKSVIKDTTEKITEDILGFVEDFGDGQITAKQLERYIKSIVEYHLDNATTEQKYIIKNSILNSIDSI